MFRNEFNVYFGGTHQLFMLSRTTFEVEFRDVFGSREQASCNFFKPYIFKSK